MDQAKTKYFSNGDDSIRAEIKRRTKLLNFKLYKDKFIIISKIRETNNCLVSTNSQEHAIS